MFYLINTPVLTTYGTYRFEGPLTEAQARALVAPGFESAVGHAGAAALLSHLLGVDIPVNRISIRMQAGDCALILRVLDRLPEGVVLDADALAKTPYELGLLTRTQ